MSLESKKIPSKEFLINYVQSLGFINKDTQYKRHTMYRFQKSWPYKANLVGTL